MRLIFSCSHVQRSTPSTIEETNETSAVENCHFLDMMDIVHLDEKWFNADKTCRKVYLTKNEEAPKRSCKSTRFLPKVMFLGAVARPRFDEDGTCAFDGKLGLWPFVSQEPARRNSCNRRAGSMVTTLVNVTAEVYREYFLKKVVPAIK
ncbi:hypothetical protein AeRB84_012861 [Aphanomyces euteiches]|nr:hypothetical protein AeRB84_012861 [Aphanomyces euteiches]